MLICLLFVLVDLSFAQTAGGGGVKDVTFFDFDGSGIDGKMKVPTGLLIQSRKEKSVLSKMFSLRENFNLQVKRDGQRLYLDLDLDLDQDQDQDQDQD